jgi:hypothetical protein
MVPSTAHTMSYGMSLKSKMKTIEEAFDSFHTTGTQVKGVRGYLDLEHFVLKTYRTNEY